MRQRTDNSVLQSTSRPVGDYRQSIQDLHSAVDRVLSMYAEINQAHTTLSQSFAAGSDGNTNWQESVVASADQAQELNAVSGVLSDLKAGLSKANSRLLHATTNSNTSSTVSSERSTLPTMLTASLQGDASQQHHHNLGASWASLPSTTSDGPPVEVPAILEQYSDMLVSLVQSKIAANQKTEGKKL
jgi:hypothetical protein|tara:strand:+ start:213 stop:773 length:561 start_codon:yes stop_codon:yes gene_type:complete